MALALAAGGAPGQQSADPYAAVKDYGLDQAGLKLPDLNKAGDRLKAGGYAKDAILSLYEAYQAPPSLGAVGIEKYKSLLEKAEGREALIKSMNDGWDLIGKGLDAVEKAQTMGDLLGQGNNAETAFRATTTALSTFAGTEFGTQLLASFGVGGPVVQAAISAVEITWDSFKELRNETNARKLESLFGMLEGDQRLFPKLSGDCAPGARVPPITSSREAVVSVFERVAGDAHFRGVFKAYVEEYMNDTFPEPGTMESLYNVLILGSGRAQDASTQAAIDANRSKITGWIQALIGQLRAEWRGRQAMCIQRKTLRQVREAFGQGRSLLSALGELDAIVKRIPEMRRFADGAPAQIVNATNSRNAARLSSIRGQAAEYAKSSVRYLPTVGANGAARVELLGKLNAVWNAASEALAKLPAAVAENFASVARANPIPPTDANNRPMRQLVPVGFDLITIDAAQNRLSQARTAQDLEKIHQALSAEIDSKWKSFEAAFDAANPEQRYDGTLYGNRYVDLRKTYLSAQYARRDAVRAAVDGYLGSARAQMATRRETIRMLVAKASGLESGTRGPDRNQTFAGQQVADVATLAAMLRAFASGRRATDAYLGLPKLVPPRWTGSEQPMLEYLDGLSRNLHNEKSRRAQERSELQSRIGELEGFDAAVSASRRRLEQEHEGLERTVKAEYLEDELSAYLDKLRGRDKLLGTLASEIAGARASAARWSDEYRKEISSIDDDIGYLRVMRGRFEKFSTAIKALEPRAVGYYNGTQLVSAFGLDGKAPVASKAEAEANAQSVRARVEELGIFRFDDANPSGIRAWVQERVSGYLKVGGGIGPYALFGADIVFTGDVQRIATAVKSISKASYGSNSYAKGIQNRTLDEALRKAVCGSAILCYTSGHLGANPTPARSTGEDEGSYPTKFDTLRGVIASKPPLKGPASELLAALSDVLNGYNAQLVREYHEIRAEAKKADECVSKPGLWRDGKCEELAAGPGRIPAGAAGGAATAAGGPGAIGQISTGAPQQSAAPGPQGAAPGTAPQMASPGPQGDKPGALAVAPGSTNARPGAAQPAGGQPTPAGALPSGEMQPSPGAGRQPVTAPSGTTGTSARLQGASPATAPGLTAIAQRPAPATPQADISAPAAPAPSPLPAASQFPPTAPTAARSAQSATAPASAPGSPPPGMMASARTLPPSGGGVGPPGGMQAVTPGAFPSGPTAMGSMQGAASAAMARPQQTDHTQAIRELYQRIAEAYLRKDARGITKWLSTKWQSSAGISAIELESMLGKTFHELDSVQFQIQGLQIQKTSETEYRVSYTASLTGRTNRTNTKFEEKASVSDTVSITPDGPRIARTSGNTLWSKK